MPNSVEAANAFLIFTLATCQECGAHYAVASEPKYPGQWVFFERGRRAISPTHVCVGGMRCILGHAIEVTAHCAVLTREGDWLTLVEPESGLSMN